MEIPLLNHHLRWQLGGLVVIICQALLCDFEDSGVPNSSSFGRRNTKQPWRPLSLIQYHRVYVYIHIPSYTNYVIWFVCPTHWNIQMQIQNEDLIGFMIRSDTLSIKVWISCLIGLLNQNCWTLLIYSREEFTDTVLRERKTFPSTWMNLSHSKVKKDSRKKTKHTNFKTYELLHTFKDSKNKK